MEGVKKETKQNKKKGRKIQTRNVKGKKAGGNKVKKSKAKDIPASFISCYFRFIPFHSIPSFPDLSLISDSKPCSIITPRRTSHLKANHSQTANKSGRASPATAAPPTTRYTTVRGRDARRYPHGCSQRN